MIILLESLICGWSRGQHLCVSRIPGGLLLREFPSPEGAQPEMEEEWNADATVALTGHKILELSNERPWLPSQETASNAGPYRTSQPTFRFWSEGQVHIRPAVG